MIVSAWLCFASCWLHDNVKMQRHAHNQTWSFSSDDVPDNSDSMDGSTGVADDIDGIIGVVNRVDGFVGVVNWIDGVIGSVDSIHGAALNGIRVLSGSIDDWESVDVGLDDIRVISGTIDDWVSVDVGLDGMEVISIHLVEYMVLLMQGFHMELYMD